MIAEFGQTKTKLQSTVTDIFDTWTPEDYLIIASQEEKVREISKFKVEVAEDLAKLKVWITKVDAMIEMLIAKELSAAVHLFEAKIKNLRERTVSIQTLHSKTNGTEHTHEVKACFEKIELSVRLLEQFRSSMDLQIMEQLKSEVECAAKMVDQ
jgi:hypothetical protein